GHRRRAPPAAPRAGAPGGPVPRGRPRQGRVPGAQGGADGRPRL
ncbi:MAG: hypothetical protein AVDCRST_MAG49-1711, partial [uncultured Thermomicrobiales bacterium]